MFAAGLLAISWAAHAAHMPLVVNNSTGSPLVSVLYFPLLILQLVALMITLLWVSDLETVVRETSSWEMIRATSHGVHLVCFTRWVAIFYQMRHWLLLLLGPRILFAGFMWLQLGDYQGHHLDLYATEITPQVPSGVAVMMLAALVITQLIQIPVLLGLNAAIGMLISAAFRKSALAGLVRTGTFAAELGLFGLVFPALLELLNADLGSHASLRLVDLVLIGIVGDQGLGFTNLPALLQLWTDVEYSVLLGGVLIMLVAIQVVLTHGVLTVTARFVASS